MDTINDIKSEYVLDVSKQNIKELSLLLSTTKNINFLVYINLSHNRIQKFMPDEFIHLNSLKYLNLSHNQIQSLNQLKLVNLIEFDVSYNQISELSKDLFGACMKNLKKLDFSYNEIIHLPPSLFKNISGSIETIKLTRNRIRYLDSDTFSGLCSLKYLFLSNNKIDRIPNDLLDDMVELNEIFLSNNNISEIPSGLFKNTKQITLIYFSKNQLKDLPNILFKGLNFVEKLYFSNNQIGILDDSLFKDNSNLKEIHFSNNHIEEITHKLFEHNLLLEIIDFQSNNIRMLPENVFDSLSYLDTIDFSFNMITEIAKSLFKHSSIQKLKFSNNKIKDLDEATFKNLKMITEIDFSNNCLREMKNFFVNSSKNFKTINFSNNFIHFLSENLLINTDDTSSNVLLDFRNNIDLNSITYVFSQLFDYYENKSVTKFFYDNYYYFRKDEINYEHFIKNSNNYLDNKLFLCRKKDYKLLNSFLLALYLNKTCSFTKSNTFNYKRDQLDLFEWTILDFLISLDDLSIEIIIHLKRFVEICLSQNPSLVNLEFKIKTPDTIRKICARNEFLLFDSFFPSYQLNKFILIKSDQLREKASIYVENKEFFLKINYAECFDLAVRNENEKIAIHLLLILKLSIMLNDVSIGSKNMVDAKFRNITDFNEKFLKVYLHKIFDLNWWGALEFILDASSDDKFLYFYDSNNDDVNKIHPKENESNVNKDFVYSKNANLLLLISKTNNHSFLKHKTTKKELNKLWKYMPRLVYYINLLIYILFVAFYSIYIEFYNDKDIKTSFSKNQMVNVSKYISIVLLIYYEFLEILQLIDSVGTGKILVYLTSYKNLIELINFTLALITINLNDEELKSAFFSITILTSYNILLLKMDKFIGIGPYIGVFSNIIKKSFKLVLIVLICLIAFLLSFRNRSNYYFSNDNNEEITNFNSSFEMSIFTVLTMAIGQVQTSGMGIDNINKINLINFFIFGLFIFLITILFMNIFTGISIDEVEKLIERSEAENISIKINYVFELKTWIKTIRSSRLFLLLENKLRLIETLLEKLVKAWFNINFINRTYEEYIRNHNLLNRENEHLAVDSANERNNEQELEKKLNTIMLEMKQLSSMCHNKFDFLERKIDLLSQK